MKLHLKKKLITATILIILTLSTIGTSLRSVSADKGGTGKYLTVLFDTPEGAPLADFSVIATKVQSGHFWVYNYSGQKWKLGAGDVSLQAYCPPGYALKSWTFIGDTTTIVEEENPTFKSEKYAEVIANFTLKMVTLTVMPVGTGSGTVGLSKEPPYMMGDMITLTAYPEEDSEFAGWGGDLVSNTNPETITLNGDTTVTANFTLKTFTLTINTIGGGSVSRDPDYANYNWGETATLVFTAEEGYHLSSVNDNGVFADLVGTDFTYSLSITFYEDHVVTATFDVNGIAIVPEGSNVTVFLSSGASLTFTTVGQSGIALGADLTGVISDEFLIWAIRTTVVIPQDESVLIILQYDEAVLNSLGIDEENITGLWRTDFVGDVNGDGVVNGQDVSIVANANPSAPGDPNWNPFLDLTGDGLINDDDVNLVNDHIGDNLDGATWNLLPGIGEGGLIRVDTDLNLIFGVTDHFSIFRGR